MTANPSNTNDRHEEELLRLARRGSSDSFGLLAQRYRPQLLRYLSGNGLTAHDAEDIVQETLARAFIHLGRYDERRSFAAWLYTIAIRLRANHYRSARVELKRKTGTDTGQTTTQSVPGFRFDPPSREIDPADAAVAAGQREDLWPLVRTLVSDTQYTVVFLRYAEDLAVADIARTMGITKIHVKVLMHRARGKLLASAAFRRTAGLDDDNARGAK